ncbi:MAG: hypothetical protein HQ591_02040 [candidate division Zixibacteria bacterium]|nr:hypothetical protein [Candidatus Tariuqbacter arcticus]
MIELRSLLCAEGIVRDVVTNNITVYNIIEEIGSVGFPLFLKKIFVFFVLNRTIEDDTEIEFDVKIINNEELLYESTVKADFQGKNRTRIIIKFDGIAVSSPGELIVIVERNGKEYGKYMIKVNHLMEPPTIEEEPIAEESNK